MCYHNNTIVSNGAVVMDKNIINHGQSLLSVVIIYDWLFQLTRVQTAHGISSNLLPAAQLNIEPWQSALTDCSR